MSIKLLVIAIASSFVLSACSKIGSGNTSIAPDSNNPAQLAENQQAPDFNLQTFDDQAVSLTSLRGKVVFVDFWAAWCPFCIEEMPEIEKIAQEFKDDLVVLGIHRTETEDVKTGEKFAKDRDVTYVLLKDTDGSVYKAYTGGRNFMPTAAFLNKEGKVVKFLYGPKTEDQMRQYVKEALGQTN